MYLILAAGITAVRGHIGQRQGHQGAALVELPNGQGREQIIKCRIRYLYAGGLLSRSVIRRENLPYTVLMPLHCKQTGRSVTCLVTAASDVQSQGRGGDWNHGIIGVGCLF